MPEKTVNKNMNFLEGDSEMCMLMRTKDWTKSSIGPIESWPQSLRTTLGILLHSGYPMFLFWGTDLICFYNDAYRPSLGQDGKHPSILGSKAVDAWPEIWDVVSPYLNQVLTTGKATWSEDELIPIYRNARMEDVYWTFSYSPVFDEHNMITGVLVICNETTSKVTTYRKLEENKDELQFAIDAAELATFDFNPMTQRFSANDRLKEWFGFPPADQFELMAAINVVAESDRENILKVIEYALDFSTGDRFEVEFTIIHPVTNIERYIRAKGKSWFNEDKFAYRLSGTLQDITNHVIARRKIEESEERFRNIADTAPVMIWMSGKDKVCHYFNTSWLNFRGRTLEEETNGGWLKGVHPEDLIRCTDIYVNAFDNREEFYMEYRLQRADGEYRWISVKGTPFFSTDDTFEGYIGACMDIHERNIHQKILQESEEKLNIVIDASELGVWELDLESFDVSYSNTYLEIFGYDKNVQLTHEQLRKHIHPDDVAIRNKAFEDAYKTGILSYESRIVWSNGDIRWIEGKGKVFYDEDKNPIKMVGTVLDITKRKQAETELSNTANRLRLALEAGKLGSYEVNIKTGEIVCTAQTKFNFGLKEDDLFTYHTLLRMIVPEDREAVKKAVQASLDNKTICNAEYRIVKADDKTIHWINALGLPVYNKQGEPIEMAGVTIDITERKLFEIELENQVMERTKELEQKNVELEKMNRELQSFAYISSHDLQEPLRKIQTFASRITDKEYMNLSDSGKDYFKRMQDSARRMQILIDELLAYSRTNTNTEERHFVKTKLKDIIDEVKEDLEMELTQKNAVIEIDDQVQQLKVIPFQFRQLIQNLISNSLKFAKEDIAPHIKITSEIADSAAFNHPKLLKNTTYCHISISDNGIGFEQEYKEKIFEVFQRLHGKQEYQGTGIGLAIVKRIIDNHNGIITASGELGIGATFDIYIPAKQK